MSQYCWNNCPENIKSQINDVIDFLQSQLKRNLHGIYLHGSLAMSSFNPLRSDIDLIVVARESLNADSQQILAAYFLDMSGNPAPIEISFVRLDDLHPWKYPPSHGFQYSEGWRERFANDLKNGVWEDWNDTPKFDEDLGSSIMVLNRRGVCLYGPPIADVFPEVPEKDYIASVLADVLDKKFGLNIDSKIPVYMILNACRTYAYFKTKRILSKDEGAIWALQSLPPRFHNIISRALESYRNEKEDCVFSKDELEDFVAFMRNELSLPIV